MPAPLPIHSQARPRQHRRSYTDESGPGAFAPLAALPRRRPSTPAKFHFRNDQDDASSPDSESDDPRPNPKPKPRLTLPSPTLTQIPFPKPIVRTASSPQILLSNGKPLKSSLKSSSSSPYIHLLPNTKFSAHHRARSAPTSPFATESAPPTPKNVHFPSKEQGGLETVRFYSRSARPASLSLSLPNEDTETETELEADLRPTSFPFPRFPTSGSSKPKRPKNVVTYYTLDTAKSSPVPAPSPHPHANVHLETLSLSSASALIPAAAFTHTPSTSAAASLALKGTLLVRNLAYVKHVAVRFTLDEWDTTSEVTAHYAASLTALPKAIYNPGSGLHEHHSSSPSSSDTDDDKDKDKPPAWDRFAFTIRLDDYAPSLAARTLWLVARFATPSSPPPPPPPPLANTVAPLAVAPRDDCSAGAGGGEWWDNNGGGNYRVAFRVREKEEEGTERHTQGRRKHILSAPCELFVYPMLSC
ncbi:hypothetical protein DXG03_001231 [Asterophora parasitica]|uniref:CBM21 domain-containing protein n=1 Tax=Asterophora parasitica TaxID=117018 RepID=A0A9P7KBQ4_9AGAR|nr:hypothetical protein DXG03_001231 [Asterophora parasitica]